MSPARTATRVRSSAQADTSRRFAARVRRRRIIRILWALGVLAVAGGLVWLVWFSSLLTVQDVRVSGVGDRLSDDVLTAADIPVGERMINIDTAAIADRIEEIADIESVGVQRSWPQAITIAVTPRTAVAVVEDDAHWWRVDPEGVLFRETSKRPKNLPVLDAPASDDATSARAAGVAVIAALPSRLVDKVERVEANSAADVRLELNGGATVVWGTSQRNADKAAVLRALRKDAPDAAVYDVSAPDHPAVTP